MVFRRRIGAPLLVDLATTALLVLFAVLLGTTLAEAKSPAAGERATALVIGNARYATLPLDNPVHDARLIASNLRKLGFDVAEHHDLGVRDFRRVVREYARRVKDSSGASVFYYAGHGVQIDGRNYLLPVDVNPREEDEVKDESVDLDELFVSRVDRSRGARIVILDACRDNPFAGKTRNIKAAGGLAEMASRGTLVAFASAPGAVAEDGPAGSNSIYTRHLAAEMMREGIEVEQMLKNVRVKVLRDTKERQIPWVNTSLTVNFAFNPLTGGSADTAAQDKVERLEAEIAALKQQLADVREASVAETSNTDTGALDAAMPQERAQPRLERELERQLLELEAARAKTRVARPAVAEPPVRTAAKPWRGATPVVVPGATAFSPSTGAASDRKRCSSLLQRMSIGEPMDEEDLNDLMSTCRPTPFDDGRTR